MATALTAEYIAREPMPAIVYTHVRHVSSRSLHARNYTGQVRAWGEFTADVWKFWQEESSRCTKILAYKSIYPTENDIRNEQYRCGEEISTSGWYANNGLRPATVIGKELDHDTEYVDWKATNGNCIVFEEVEGGLERVFIADDATKKESDAARKNAKATARGSDTENPKVVIMPDYALIDRKDGTPRAVGEAKTPGNHPFDLWWATFTANGRSERLGQLLGPITNYMLYLNLKYGFVTNYEHTFFLMQDYEMMKSGDFMEVLYCSPPIKYDTIGNHENVSVRQCLVYLQHLVKTRWMFDSQREGCVAQKGKGGSQKDYVARMAQLSAKANAPTPVQLRSLCQQLGGSEESPLARKYMNDDTDYLAQEVEDMEISPREYNNGGYPDTREGYQAPTGGRSTLERGPKKSRNHERSYTPERATSGLSYSYNPEPCGSPTAQYMGTGQTYGRGPWGRSG